MHLVGLYTYSKREIYFYSMFRELRNLCRSSPPTVTQDYMGYRTSGPVTDLQGNIPREQIYNGENPVKNLKVLMLFQIY